MDDHLGGKVSIGELRGEMVGGMMAAVDEEVA